jgi:hypothetical protein
VQQVVGQLLAASGWTTIGDGSVAVGKRSEEGVGTADATAEAGSSLQYGLEVEMPYLASTMESKEQVQSLLDKWSGHSARLYSYTLSLSILQIAVTDRRFSNGIMIQCLDVRSIVAQVGWPRSAFSVEFRSDGKLGVYVLRDRATGVEVVSADISIEKFEEVVDRSSAG